MFAKLAWTTMVFFGITLALSANAEPEKREKIPVNKILETAAAEKASIEKDYKAQEALARQEAERTEFRAIAVEIGDGMAPEGGEIVDRVKFRGSDRTYSERSSASKLEREWKEVNREMKRKLSRKHVDTKKKPAQVQAQLDDDLSF